MMHHMFGCCVMLLWTTHNKECKLPKIKLPFRGGLGRHPNKEVHKSNLLMKNISSSLPFVYVQCQNTQQSQL